MFADVERKIVDLIDNAKQAHKSLTENTLEIKKILKIINFDLCGVTYVTIINVRTQKHVLTYNEAVHNRFLKLKVA